MKAKINTDNSFGGLYTEEFIESNIYREVNGELVSEWVLINELPDSDLYIPIFENGQWIEGATEEDFNNKKEALISELNRQQHAEMLPTDFYFNNDWKKEIPQAILDERSAIRLKYQELENDIK
jgi:hypothetical protein